MRIVADHPIEIVRGISQGFGPVGPGNLFFEPLAINEAMADVFADQLIGGGNRLAAAFPGTYTGGAIGAGVGVAEAYCDPTFPTPGAGGCFDFNITGTEVGFFAGPNAAINLEASRISTTLHDIWDDSVGGANHNGNVWAPLTAGCIPALATCPSATALVATPDPSAGCRSS